MNIIRIPFIVGDRHDGNPYVRSLEIRDALINDFELVENRDFDVHYSSKLKAIELRCYTVQESVASMITLRYVK